MKIQFCILILFLTVRFVLSNDAFLHIAGGTVKPVVDSLTNVCMDSEVVVITLEQDHFIVEAEFYFSNYGKTEIVSVGFPKYSYGYYGINGYYGISQFNEFETWVNDIPTQYQEVYGELRVSNGIDDYHLKLAGPYDLAVMVQEGLLEESTWVLEKKWLIKNVVFKENTVTSTRVKYSCSYADYGFYKGFEYLYGTGRTWKGKIKKSKFIIINESNILLYSSLFKKNIVQEEYELDRIDEQIFEIVIKNFEPKEDAILRFFFSEDDLNWFGIDGELKNKLILEENLVMYNLEQLRIIRNTIFAKRGRVFNSPELDTYFRSQYWYKPNPEYSDNLLNNIELTNIQTIIEYEKYLKK